MKKSEAYNQITSLIEDYLLEDGIKGRVSQEQEYIHEAWVKLRFAKQFNEYNENSLEFDEDGSVSDPESYE